MGRIAGGMSIIGKVFFSLIFGVIFVGAGCLFFYFTLSRGLAENDARSWEPTSCTILESRIEKKDQSYSFVTRYTYEYKGRSHTSSKVKIGYDGDGEYADAQRLAFAYPVESKATCYVNPDEPSRAVLRHGFPTTLLMLPLPLLFVVVGCVVVYFVWFGKSSNDPDPNESISDKDSDEMTFGGRIGMALFFSVFFLMGSGFLVGFFILPVYRMASSSGWPETPCTVIESEVWSHDSDDGTTYSVNILYEYKFDGTTYRSNRYTFMTGSSSGYNGKKQVVDAHPPGRKTVCYVNPDDPHEAVLDRGASTTMLFGLIPLVFVVVGAGGMGWAIFGGRKKKHPGSISDKAVDNSRPATRSVSRASSSPAPTVSTITSLSHDGEEGQVTLEPRGGRIGGLIFLCIFALIWNGFIWGGAWDMASSGGFALLMLLFMLPFIAVGIGLIAACIYIFLSLFNPTPRLVLGTGHLPLGGSTWLEYSLKGNPGSLQNLTIRLEGLEAATYRRGTDTVTEKHVFHRETLLQTDHRATMMTGRLELHVPFETMHSFESDNNKIVWQVTVNGDIPYWPDIDESFEITVLPLSPGEGT